MDMKAAVIEMVNAIETLALFASSLWGHGHGAVLVNARAACNYILTVETQFAERDAQIAEMRLVTGPKCPKCGHWLKAEHTEIPTYGTGSSPTPAPTSSLFRCWIGDNEHEPICGCEIAAEELGLTEANE